MRYLKKAVECSDESFRAYLEQVVGWMKKSELGSTELKHCFSWQELNYARLTKDMGRAEHELDAALNESEKVSEAVAKLC